MRRILALAAIFLLAAVALGNTTARAADAMLAKPRSYLALPATGKYSADPYVWERQWHRKHIAIVGTIHNRDPHAVIFDRIEAVFQRVHPQLVIHEAEAPPALLTLPRDQAIAAGGDMGFAVYLAGRAGAAIQSGDAPVAKEIKALLAHYPAADVAVFLTAQRLIGSGRNPDLRASATEYPAFVKNYLAGNGLPTESAWATWEGFLREYARVERRPLTSRSWDPDRFVPIRNSGRLNQIVRTSCEFRDSYLLATIRKALHDHDRVVVVFGTWHVFALEPVLDSLLATEGAGMTATGNTAR